MQLHGPAKSMQMAKMSYENKWLDFPSLMGLVTCPRTCQSVKGPNNTKHGGHEMQSTGMPAM